MFGGKCYRDEVHVMLIAVWRTRKRVVWCARSIARIVGFRRAMVQVARELVDNMANCVAG